MWAGLTGPAPSLNSPYSHELLMEEFTSSERMQSMYFNFNANSRTNSRARKLEVARRRQPQVNRRPVDQFADAFRPLSDEEMANVVPRICSLISAIK